MGTEEYLPRPETKQSLDDLFYESHPKATPVWYNSVIAVIVPRDKQVHRQPLLQVAAVALLLLLVVPFFSSNDLTAESDLVAEQNVELTEDVDDVTTETKIISEVLDEVPEEEDVILEVESSVAQELASPGTLASNVGMNTPLMSTRPNDHPDGIFAGIDSDALALSQPADEASELLDLLTATF